MIIGRGVPDGQIRLAFQRRRKKLDKNSKFFDFFSVKFNGSYQFGFKTLKIKITTTSFSFKVGLLDQKCTFLPLCNDGRQFLVSIKIVVINFKGDSYLIFFTTHFETCLNFFFVLNLAVF